MREMDGIELKVGDIVIIDERCNVPSGVPAIFVQEMSVYSGKMAKVKHVSKFPNSIRTRYYLDVDDSEWKWTIDMFKYVCVGGCNRFVKVKKRPDLYHDDGDEDDEW